MAGRPSEYNETIAGQICELVSDGENLHRICQMDEMPSRQTVYKWMRQQAAFADKYARAREARSDARADRIDTIVSQVLSGEVDPASARVAIDAEKWQAGKENPKRYGDRITTEHEGTVEVRHNRIERLIVQPSGEAKPGEAG